MFLLNYVEFLIQCSGFKLVSCDRKVFSNDVESWTLIYNLKVFHIQSQRFIGIYLKFLDCAHLFIYEVSDLPSDKFLLKSP